MKQPVRVIVSEPCGCFTCGSKLTPVGVEKGIIHEGYPLQSVYTITTLDCPNKCVRVSGLEPCREKAERD